jgi:hypothetical protein
MLEILEKNRYTHFSLLDNIFFMLVFCLVVARNHFEVMFFNFKYILAGFYFNQIRDT